MSTAVAPGSVLICAATRWEMAPLSRRLAPGFSDRRIVLLQTGIGAGKTEQSLRAFGDPAGLSAVISAGLAGALQDDLQSGDIVMDVQGAPSQWAPAAREAALALGLPFYFGKIMHADRVLGPDEKRALGSRTRGCAVDMETRAIRAWAQTRGVPMVALRAVLDRIDDRLPEDAPEGEGAASALRYALAHAGSLPRLAAVGFKSARAMRRLAALLERLVPVL